MTDSALTQKKPSEIYDDWERTVESLNVIYKYASFGKMDILPNWAMHLCATEIESISRALLSETNVQYAFFMLAAIEGLFQRHIRQCVNRDIKSKLGKKFRVRFIDLVKKGKYIRIDDILDSWNKLNPASRELIGDFRSKLQYRDWLAHGRHWIIHYRNVPDPDEVFQLFTVLQKSICFKLDF